MNRPEAMPHDEAIELLPWLVNESLTADERQAVSIHATACVICRRELEQLRALRGSIRRSFDPVEIPGIDMRRINARIDAELERENPGSRLLAMLRELFQRPWRIAFVAQSVALVIAVAMLLQSPENEPEFVTLTTPEALAAGHYVRVVFDPTIDATTVDRLLAELELRIADGPTARGVYTLRFAENLRDSDRGRLLGELRGDERVLFAEPVGGGDR